MTKISLPTARAAAALRRKDPDAALRELDGVRPYDLSWVTELAPVYYRAAAYLQLKRPTEAREQFQKALDHWTTRPEAAYVPLSHLGLAHVNILQADKVSARLEYERFLALWKDADSDVPVLRRARAEYALIQ